MSIFRRAKPTEGDANIQTDAAKKPGLVGRLGDALSRTRGALTGGLSGLLREGAVIDDDTLLEVETMLLSADVGVEASERLIASLRERAAREGLHEPKDVLACLRATMLDILAPVSVPLVIPSGADSPFVILVVGVNGTGKTTTIGKLACRYQALGHSVMLAAGDTFRAAAVEQLQAWGERNEVPVIAQHSGADSASVIFDAVQAAGARGTDILIADTAGRLHTQGGLMDELGKVARVMKKIDPDAPHETMLVVDSGTGQNALNQAEQFNAALGLSGITLTKLDGTAKGGIVFAMAERLSIPVRFIGVGEQLDDLRTFESVAFVDALLTQ